MRPIPCFVCGKSKSEILAAFDAFLCASINRAACSVSTLLPLARPYMDYSERELVSAAAYLWGTFLGEEGGSTTEGALSSGVSPFLSLSQQELLAMQLILLCRFGLDSAECDATTLLNGGRCFCVSYKELLAIRVYLIGVFVNNFVVVNMDPTVLRQHVSQYIPDFVSITTLEAVQVYALCQLYNVAVENNQPT